MVLQIMEGKRIDDHVIKSLILFIQPKVLRNVNSMALDELDVVYDLDTKVSFEFNLLEKKKAILHPVLLFLGSLILVCRTPSKNVLDSILRLESQNTQILLLTCRSRVKTGVEEFDFNLYTCGVNNSRTYLLHFDDKSRKHE